MSELTRLEEDARKDLDARRLASQAISLWIEVGYSEEEMEEFISELYDERQ